MRYNRKEKEKMSFVNFKDTFQFCIENPEVRNSYVGEYENLSSLHIVISRENAILVFRFHFM